LSGPAAKKHKIQVPIDDGMFAELVDISKKARVSQAQVMREAFASYQRSLKAGELDRRYYEGYRKHPPDLSIGESQLTVMGEVFDKEDW
jgi:hypothetical protein